MAALVPASAINDAYGQGRENQAETKIAFARGEAGFAGRVSWGMRIKCSTPRRTFIGRASFWYCSRLPQLGDALRGPRRSPADASVRAFPHQRAAGARTTAPPESPHLLHIEVDAIKNRALIDHKHRKLFENVRGLPFNGLR